MAQFIYHNFTVPAGRVAILRGYRYGLDPLTAGLSSSDVIARLMVGAPVADRAGIVIIQRGITVDEYSNLRHGLLVQEYQPCYVVAGPGETISMLITLSAAVPTINNADIEFYGNLLQSTGRPTAFEPGTSPIQDVRLLAKDSEPESIQQGGIGRKVVRRQSASGMGVSAGGSVAPRARPRYR